MMQTPIVFFGSSNFVLPILEELKNNFSLSLVVTTEQKASDAVPQYCQKNNIPYVSISNFSEELEKKLLAIGAPVGVLADFGIIVSKKIINIFPKGIINIHPSLLPTYRGATPVQTALLDGLNETGVSIMLLDEKLDSGPILFQQTETILPTETAKSLYEKLFTIGAKKLPQIIAQYVDNKLQPTPQTNENISYTKTLTRESGYIDANHPPQNLQNMIKAYFPWPGVWTKMNLFGKEKMVKLLPNNMLQVEGKKPMTTKDFLNGYPDTKEILQKLGLL